MEDILLNPYDPCNPSPISSGCMLILCAIIALQITGFCMPVLDYIKFTVISILMYFYYEVVIKAKKPLCGNICLCILIFTVILTGLCIRFKQPGELGGYILLVFGFLPLTLCTISRLYFEGGPFTTGFWNPVTITKIYID